MSYTDRTIQLADSLFETYSLNELSNLPYMLGEIASMAYEISRTEVMTAVHLAARWKETEETRRYLLH